MEFLLPRFLETMRRYSYTTPKSYLEFGALYKLLLAQKRSELKRDKERLENGVDKIAQASAQASIAQDALSFSETTFTAILHAKLRSNCPDLKLYVIGP